MDNIAQFRPPLRFTFAPRASSLSSSTQGGFPIQNNNSHVNFSSPGCNKNFAPRINLCCGNYPPIKNFAADCNLQYPRQLPQQHHINIRSKWLFASQLPSFRYASKSSSMLMAPPLMSQHLKKTGCLVWTSLESPTGKKGGGSLATVCACKNACAANETLRWIFVGASLLLLLAKRTGVRKEHVVTMLALQLPNCAVTWIRGQRGLWVAFLGTIIQLFHFIPERLLIKSAELEVPLNVLLLIITAPCQAMHTRASAASSVLSLAMTSLLAYQHFSWLAKVANPSQEVISLTSAGILTLFIISLILIFRRL